MESLKNLIDLSGNQTNDPLICTPIGGQIQGSWVWFPPRSIGFFKLSMSVCDEKFIWGSFHRPYMIQIQSQWPEVTRRAGWINGHPFGEEYRLLSFCPFCHCFSHELLLPVLKVVRLEKMNVLRNSSTLYKSTYWDITLPNVPTVRLLQLKLGLG